MKPLWILAIVLTGAFILTSSIPLSEEVFPFQKPMKSSLKLLIQVGDQKFEIKLDSNPTSQSLLDQAPFSVEFEDFAGLEKIFYPPKKLSKENAPSGAKPSKGDIMYYAPWGDVALFYKDAGYASGLIPMGKIEDIDGLVKALSKSEKATIIKI